MTELQQTLLDFIAAHQEARGGALSGEEIARAFRYRNDTTVLRSVEALAPVYCRVPPLSTRFAALALA